jgi:hypothetical protein
MPASFAPNPASTATSKKLLIVAQRLNLCERPATIKKSIIKSLRSSISHTMMIRYRPSPFHLHRQDSHPVCRATVKLVQQGLGLHDHKWMSIEMNPAGTWSQPASSIVSSNQSTDSLGSPRSNSANAMRSLARRSRPMRDVRRMSLVNHRDQIGRAPSLAAMPLIKS